VRVGEEHDTVLIESRGTVAFCFGKFKESCVCAYWYQERTIPKGGVKVRDELRDRAASDFYGWFTFQYSLMIVDECSRIVGHGRRPVDGVEKGEG